MTWLWVLAACKKDVVPVSVPDAQPETSTGIDQLAAQYWERTMREHPTWASHLGDHRYDAKVQDLSPEADAAWNADLKALGTKVDALEGLSDEDALTAALLRADLHSNELERICDFGTWQFSARQNPFLDLGGTADLTEVKTAQDADNWIARVEGFTAQLAVDATNRATGVAAGRAPTAQSVSLVLEQIAPSLEAPVDALPMMKPLLGQDEDVLERGRVAATAYQKALAVWVGRIRDEVLPIARGPQDPPGLSGLPGGPACYTAMIEHHTSLPLSADTIHQTGLDEIARLHAEVTELGAQHGHADVQAVFTWLRTDRALYFETAEQVEEKAEEALSRAAAAVPEWFGIQPETPCEVARIPDYLAPYTTIAYYQPLAVGERPGTYYVNTHAPETRPRHEAEVLAFHESIPGHHLQIAISQERSQLPDFRKHMSVTAFVEGWALYTEQLADEMGLYSSDTDRFGMYSFELWRAARLVVDTGLHHKGWSRQQAIDYMIENTPLAENNIVNEVDRYINTPGQALAYKTGQLEIWRLRRKAEAELGERFDIKRFHDVVLGAGAVTLPVLAERVDAWIASHG